MIDEAELRLPETCPYRQSVKYRNGYQHIQCRFVDRAIGAMTGEPSFVHRKTCEHCCTFPIPIDSALNPVVAASINIRLRQIIERGGTHYCTVEQARSLKEPLRPYLKRQPQQSKTGRSMQDRCFFMGKHIGQQTCPTCKGSVQLKVFDCHHRSHENTTCRQCRVCPDFEPALKKGMVRTWAVGITTAPRQEPTFHRTVASLYSSGWTDLHLFAEPDVNITPHTRIHLTRRTSKLGAWPNWYLSLAELVMLYPKVDAYMMCQDDVVVAANLRSYLEKHLWPAQRVGVVSIYSPSHYLKIKGFGFLEENRGETSWGALAYVIPHSTARLLLSDHNVANHRLKGPRDGLCNIDSVVGKFCIDSSLPYFVHCPSLAQHIGNTSTIYKNASRDHRRYATDFVGERFDLLEYLSDNDSPVRIMGLPND